jgi:hypothetical protein
LCTGQTTGSQNLIYVVTTVGSGSNGTWTTAYDDNTTGELDAGTIVMVTEGLVYADTQWKLITDNPIVIGTTSLTWTQNYSANSISAGTSNVVVSSNANVTISSAGTPNVLVISSTGTVTNGTSNFAGNLIPTANATYSLGSATNYWKSLYVAGNSIYLGNVTLGATSGVLTVNGANVLTSDSGGNISTTGNITGGNILTTGIMSSTGNATHGNITTAGIISVAGNIIGTTITTTVGSNGNLTLDPDGVGDVVLPINTELFVLSGANTTSTTSGAVQVTGGIGLTGNVYAGGLVSATGNIAGGNVLTGGLISATGNLTGGNVLTSGIMSSTGNATHGNVLTGGLISATGNVTGNYILGNGALLTGVITSVANINNGTSNVTVVSSNGNVTVGVGGTGNVAVFATTGEYVTGVVSASGNITGGNILTGGIISLAGNIYTGNILTNGYYYANGTAFSGGSGSGGATYTRTSFTASAAQTTFSVTYTVGYIQVYVNGVLLNASDYTASNGTSVVLAVACNSGDIVETIAFNTLAVVTNITSQDFSGTGSQTAFTMNVTPPSAASILVAISGVVQDPVNYTVSGTTLTFSTAPGVGTNNISVRYLGIASTAAVSSFSGGTTGLTPSTATTGAITLGGTLAVANGGTGVTTSTGTGNSVLSNSPTLSSPAIAGATSGAITLAAPSVAGTNTVTFPAGTGTVAVQGVSTNIVSGTAQNSTSGTSITFTGIPSWVKRITVMLNGVSTNGTSYMQVQVGSGSVTTSGYTSSLSTLNGSNYNSASSTTGLLVTGTNNSAASNYYSVVVINLVGSNNYVSFTNTSTPTSSFCYNGSGAIGLSGALDRVVVTTVNGTDTFDAGSINILYE